MASDDTLDPGYQVFARLRDTGYGMLAWCVVTAGVRTMRDDEYADLAAEVERLAAAEERAEQAEKRVRALGGDLAFWHEEAHAARAWLGRLVERGCVPDEWQRYVAQFADATPTPRQAGDEAASIAFAACEALVLAGDITEARGLAARALLRRRGITDSAAGEAT